LAHEHVQNDSIATFTNHKESVYCVNVLPREPYNIFISGDGNDKALIWKLTSNPSDGEESKNNRMKAELYKSLPGHTETIEFVKFSHDGKLLATGGMNNAIRVWDVEKDYELKSTLEGPTDDLNFLHWHPKGNVILTGGKDYMIWMFNGQNGEFLSCFAGHEDEVLDA
jgi:WD40 repeat protein